MENMLSGKGIMIWPDGRKYDGEYSENERNGYGEFYWPNGKIYKGQWMNGR